MSANFTTIVVHMITWKKLCSVASTIGLSNQLSF